MFRNFLLKSLRSTPRSTARRIGYTPLVTRTSFPTAQPCNFVRSYAGFPELTRDNAKERIIELLEGFDKVDQGKTGGIQESSSFVSDLGLDSLDVVEVVMELEHEFNIQIPDNEADSIKTVGQAIDYIMSQPDSC
ncbi:uncharacterized protein LODBEIA_P24470 [Lodderomyces beijingensis]|uniref:Acyl carrier protein n=1 Tax=Lodderomyces beijingensis TaxID=1775926 RepID=A0ABP0ZKP6_9ASCO